MWACGDLAWRATPGAVDPLHHQGRPHGQLVAQVAEDPDGSIWVGYRDAYGLTHLTFAGSGTADAAGRAFQHRPTAFDSDKTLFLGFDSRGRLWVGTDHGVDVTITRAGVTTGAPTA